MHFSIPDTQEQFVNNSATTYTVYNIYINGNYHCCLRYKQLHALHEQLRRLCAFEPDLQLPVFPPKRLLPLTNTQLETRRAGLEHYLQLIGQDVRIARLEYLQQFLVRAQIETALAEGAIESNGANTKLDVLLAADGCTLPINCRVNQNASILLRSICSALKLPESLTQYFCLFLVREDRIATDVNELVLLRRLMDFESPYISRLHAQPCQLLLRKSYWNPMWDLKLQRDAVALNLLYLQSVGDIAREWIIASPDVLQKLHDLEECSLKKEYMDMVRKLPLYGCLQFNNALVDYPEPDTNAIISIGNKELSIRTPRGAKIYETKFRVTRMRCWRVSAIHNTLESRDQPTHLQLSFEYLMSKQTLRWITITSDQAMIMSVCLQSMVDELLNNEDEDLDAGPSSSAAAAAVALRNGRATSTSSSSASSTPSSAEQTCTSLASTSSSNYTNNYLSNTNNSPGSPIPPVKFLAQRLAPSSKQQHKLTMTNTFSAVFFRNDDSVHNEAFEGIGDDDL